jgi:NADPH:quinone reductase-like Zn-dependent oxidoreductase
MARAEKHGTIELDIQERRHPHGRVDPFQQVISRKHDLREFGGRSRRLGAAVRDFEVGDAVTGITGLAFGGMRNTSASGRMGRLESSPPGAGFDVAAACLDGPTDALAKLRRAPVSRGQRVLVYRASGSIGTAAVQLAELMGREVTAVCDTNNVDLVRSVGEDSVVDYKREDFTASGETYGVIFDAVGKQSYLRCRRSLRPGGRFVFTDGGMKFAWLLLTGVWAKSPSSSPTVSGPRTTSGSSKR